MTSGPTKSKPMNQQEVEVYLQQKLDLMLPFEYVRQLFKDMISKDVQYDVSVIVALSAIAQTWIIDILEMALIAKQKIPDILTLDWKLGDQEQKNNFIQSKHISRALVTDKNFSYRFLQKNPGMKRLLRFEEDPSIRKLTQSTKTVKLDDDEKKKKKSTPRTQMQTEEEPEDSKKPRRGASRRTKTKASLSIKAKLDDMEIDGVDLDDDNDKKKKEKDKEEEEDEDFSEPEEDDEEEDDEEEEDEDLDEFIEKDK